jgi:hypothetical protein
MLEIWTVYDHPSDFPDSFVAHKFVLDQPTDEIMIAATLPDLRKMIQNLSGNLAIPINSPTTLIQRWPDDDPKIVESWL